MPVPHSSQGTYSAALRPSAENPSSPYAAGAMHLLRKLRRRRLRVVDLRANAISYQRLTTQRPSAVFFDLKKCRLAALPFNCHICAHTPTLLKRNRYRAYKLQMELQSTLVHEALAAVVALDRRIKLRANVLDGPVARPRSPLVSLRTNASMPDSPLCQTLD